MENNLKNYIEKLDLYIVSHGGVGSNYLVNFLNSKNINVKYDQINYNNTCHYPYKLIEDKPTIFIYGDLPKSIISQYNKNFLHINGSKINMKKTKNFESLEYLIKNFPNDPIGIIKQFNNFKDTKNTIFVKYPFNRKTIKKSLSKLGFKGINFSDFKFNERKSKNENITDQELLYIIKIYENYNFD